MRLIEPPCRIMQTKSSAADNSTTDEQTSWVQHTSIATGAAAQRLRFGAPAGRSHDSLRIVLLPLFSATKESNSIARRTTQSCVGQHRGGDKALPGLLELQTAA